MRRTRIAPRGSGASGIVWQGIAATLGIVLMACGAGQIEPGAYRTGVRFELTADEGGLTLRGSPLDAAYQATYPNPDRLGRLTAELLSNGSFATECDGAPAGGRCTDPPFAAFVSWRPDLTRLRVQDLFGKAVADVTLRNGQTEPSSDHADLDQGTPAPSTPDDVCPSGSCGPGETQPPGTGDTTPPDTTGGACADVPAQVCAIVNDAITAHGGGYVLDCALLGSGPYLGLVEPSLNPLIPVPCHDLTLNAVTDELLISGSLGPACAAVAMNVASNANMRLIDDGVCITSPLALDLGGGGIRLTSAASGVRFDLTGRGHARQCAWIAGDTAWLVRDRNGNGLVDDATELFGEFTDGRPHADGFAALAEVDENEDGLVDSRDPGFGDLRLWLDRGHDGFGPASELVTLAEAGITALDVRAQRRLAPAATDAHGNLIPLVSSFRRADGGQGELADVYPLCR